jgi:cellobiose-specific phosphotransferase system component IIA
MSEPKQVLLVTNSATEAEIHEIQQSILQAENHGIKIKVCLVHVIPTLPTCYFNIPSMVLLAERYYEEAKKTLTYVGDLLKVEQKDQWLISGRIRTEVLRLAHKLQSSFILASTASVQDLQKSYIFNREPRNSPIKSFSHLSSTLK